MGWLPLESITQLNTILQDSFTTPIVILKHSTRCSISDMALARLNRSQFSNNAKFYLLDLLQHRDISNAIADKLNIYHQSPQILVVKNGICIYDDSHQSIQMEDILEVI